MLEHFYSLATTPRISFFSENKHELVRIFVSELVKATMVQMQKLFNQTITPTFSNVSTQWSGSSRQKEEVFGIPDLNKPWFGV
jgi:hypothetical protein